MSQLHFYLLQEFFDNDCLKKNGLDLDKAKQYNDALNDCYMSVLGLAGSDKNKAKNVLLCLFLDEKVRSFI